MRTFRPSDPLDTYKSQIEIENWKVELDEKKTQEKKEKRRFIITAVISAVSAVAAVVAAVASVISYLI